MSERLQVDSQSDAAEVTSNGAVNGFDCILGAWHGHEAELRGFLINRLRDRDAAEDLLQEVFLRAMREGEGFCQLDNPRAWLFRVARNAAVDSERRQRPRVPVPDDMAAEESALPPVDALGECLERNLAELSPTDRDIVEACDLRGGRQSDFAAERGLSLNAVKSRLFRARRRLREQLVRNCRVRFDEQGRVCCHRPRRAVGEGPDGPGP